MNWLNRIVDKLVEQHPDENSEIVVSSGVSPSGTYHLGTLREVLTAEAICRELKLRGRTAKHIHVVDDLDSLRKVPVDVDESFSQYLGMPLCDVPSPDPEKGSSYADYFLSDLLEAAKGLRLDMEIMRSNEKYRNGFFVDAIEKTLDNIPAVRKALEEVSGRTLDPNWSPVQVIENGRLKNRKFLSIDKESQNIVYENADGNDATASYTKGDVKLNWRIDWPARWWKLNVQAEPFGRDHATKGGSYDTGAVIVRDVFGGEPPLPVPYDFINKTGDTKKMSKSAGDTVTAADLLKILPAELVWFFILRYGPEKLLFFDTGDTLIRLFDEFSELLAKTDKTRQDERLLELCLYGVDQPTVSRVPFTHLYVSYQASLRDPQKTIDVISRTEHADVAQQDEVILRRELAFIDEWLNVWADEDSKFDIVASVDQTLFSDEQKSYLSRLADRISEAPADADGEWFHKVVYDFKDQVDLEPKQLFTTLYQVLIAKDSGPRAGWFLSTLDKDWLAKRLRLEG
jgi:lysyl-tRNA synthetase class 1